MTIKSYWPVLPLALLWLVARLLQLGPPLSVGDSVVFLLPGFLSSLIAVFLYLSARPGVQRGLVIAGYIITLPVAFLGALGSGMVLPVVIGVTLVGTILSAIGS
ncbi:MAG TPA: hypothetical protein VK821_14415, partial [Dehalococcoidia bacterium]|nr:hypothetical protein [Dehalococcoidia bacterium]